MPQRLAFSHGFPWEASVRESTPAHPSPSGWEGRRAAQELARGVATLIYRLEGVIHHPGWGGCLVWCYGAGERVIESAWGPIPPRLLLRCVSRWAEELLCGEAGLDVRWEKLPVSTLRGKRANILFKEKVWIARNSPRLAISPSCSGQL